MATKTYGDKPRSSYILAAEAAARELEQQREQESMLRWMSRGPYDSPMPGLTNKEAGKAEQAATDTLVGIPEAALTMGSSVLADIPAGYAGMTAAGDDRISSVDAIEKTQNALTYQPRTESGKRVMAGLGNTMNSIMEPITKGVDTTIQAGTDAGLPPWMMAAPLTALTAGMEVVPGPQKGAAKAGRYVRAAEEAASAVDADLLAVADKYDPNLARGAEDLAAGRPMREVDPDLVDRRTAVDREPVVTDAEIKAGMDAEVGSARRMREEAANDGGKKHRTTNYLNQQP